ncbi:MAG: photosynthetic complex assembly protein PuhC [Luminiphilus sp.]|nr:photosynthetic complex assembly protein PuhC [Luminiphilus sp.]
MTREQTTSRGIVGHPMVWVVLAMALLWAWGLSRQDGSYVPPVQQASPSISSTNLLFIDGPKGRIDVLEAETHSPLAAYDSGEGSFLRGILRSLVRERRVRDIDSGGKFNLAMLENGSLVISDPETGYWMALEAFGLDNRRIFAEILQRATALDLVAMGAGESEQ